MYYILTLSLDSFIIIISLKLILLFIIYDNPIKHDGLYKRKSNAHGALLYGIYPRPLWHSYLGGSVVYALSQYD